MRAKAEFPDLPTCYRTSSRPQPSRHAAISPAASDRSLHRPPRLSDLAVNAQEDDDALSAEAFIKKAAPLLSAESKEGQKDEALELQFKTCYARVLDSKVRRFRQPAIIAQSPPNLPLIFFQSQPAAPEA